MTGRADYFASGDWNAICYECGRKRKASKMRKHWRNYWVCPEHWEPRHPQDFVRAVPDQTAPYWAQPEGSPYTGPVAILEFHNYDWPNLELLNSIYRARHASAMNEFLRLGTPFTIIDSTIVQPYPFSARDWPITINQTGQTRQVKLKQYLLDAERGAWIIDPNFSSVVLLLHMDGTDASTTFTDSSSSAKTVTAHGNAQIDTAQSKFGGASALFDGTGDYIDFPLTSSDFNFGTGDFTIEFWYRKSASAANGTYTRLIQFRDGDQFSSVSLADAGAAGQITVAYSSNGTSWDIGSADNLGTVALNTWYHLAVCRSSTNIRTFFNGAVAHTQSTSAALFYNSADVGIIGGQSTPNRTITGWIDDFRITKGVARYTAAFSVPTAAFPDA